MEDRHFTRENYSVLKSKSKDDMVIHEVYTGKNGRETFRYSSIKVGAVWPNDPYPAYYVILAEEHVPTPYYEGEKPKRGRLLVLSEFQTSNLDLSVFNSKLTDDLTLFHCDRIFTNTDEQYLSYEEGFKFYQNQHKIMFGRIEQAPYADNFRLAVSLIKEWKKSGTLIVPKGTVIREQFSQLEPDELPESPEEVYYAIQGLGYAVAAFFKFGPSVSMSKIYQAINQARRKRVRRPLGTLSRFPR